MPIWGSAKSSGHKLIPGIRTDSSHIEGSKRRSLRSRPRVEEPNHGATLVTESQGIGKSQGRVEAAFGGRIYVADGLRVESGAVIGYGFVRAAAGSAVAAGSTGASSAGPERAAAG